MLWRRSILCSKPAMKVIWATTYSPVGLIKLLCEISVATKLEAAFEFAMQPSSRFGLQKLKLVSVSLQLEFCDIIHAMDHIKKNKHPSLHTAICTLEVEKPVNEAVSSCYTTSFCWKTWYNTHTYTQSLLTPTDIQHQLAFSSFLGYCTGSLLMRPLSSTPQPAACLGWVAALEGI